MESVVWAEILDPSLGYELLVWSNVKRDDTQSREVIYIASSDCNL